MEKHRGIDREARNDICLLVLRQYHKWVGSGEWKVLKEIGEALIGRPQNQKGGWRWIRVWLGPKFSDGLQ